MSRQSIFASITSHSVTVKIFHLRLLVLSFWVISRYQFIVTTRTKQIKRTFCKEFCSKSSNVVICAVFLCAIIFPSLLDRSQPLFYFAPLFPDSHSQAGSTPNLWRCNFSTSMCLPKSLKIKARKCIAMIKPGSEKEGIQEKFKGYINNQRNSDAAHLRG